MMRQYTREEFYEMHKEPLLQRFKEDVEKVLGVELPGTPEIGSLDISSVLEADYFFH